MALESRFFSEFITPSSKTLYIRELVRDTTPVSDCQGKLLPPTNQSALADTPQTDSEYCGTNGDCTTPATPPSLLTSPPLPAADYSIVEKVSSKSAQKLARTTNTTDSSKHLLKQVGFLTQIEDGVALFRLRLTKVIE